MHHFFRMFDYISDGVHMDILVTKSSCKGVVIDIACHSVSNYYWKIQQNSRQIPHHVRQILVKKGRKGYNIMVVIGIHTQCIRVYYSNLYLLHVQGFITADPKCSFRVRSTILLHMNVELVEPSHLGCLESTTGELINTFHKKVPLKKVSVHTMSADFVDLDVQAVLHTACTTYWRLKVQHICLAKELHIPSIQPEDNDMFVERQVQRMIHSCSLLNYKSINNWGVVMFRSERPGRMWYQREIVIVLASCDCPRQCSRNKMTVQEPWR